MLDAVKIAEYRQARELRVTQAKAEHSDFVAGLTGPLRAVADLHAPDEEGDCAGCDFVGHLGDCGPPSWPCRTIDTIRVAIQHEQG